MKPSRFSIATMVLVLAFQSLAAGQRLDAGPQVLTFFSEVDDTDQPYALYFPRISMPQSSIRSW